MRCAVVLFTRDVRCNAPWKLARQPQGYPEPIVDHREAVARLRAIQETRG